MSHKEKIIRLLKTNKSMTQGELAEAIFGDKYHTASIYFTLIQLVKNGMIIRSEPHPAIYFLNEKFSFEQENLEFVMRSL